MASARTSRARPANARFRASASGEGGARYGATGVSVGGGEGVRGGGGGPGGGGVGGGGSRWRRLVAGGRDRGGGGRGSAVGITRGQVDGGERAVLLMGASGEGNIRSMTLPDPW